MSFLLNVLMTLKKEYLM